MQLLLCSVSEGLSFYGLSKECKYDFNHAKNDDLLTVTIILEILNDHALSVDFGMFLIISMVQIIVYPTFHKIKEEQFVGWHRKYCNAIGVFVLPLMICQLLESASACFFSVGDLPWVKLTAVLGAWLVTFFISAPCHRILQDGKNTAVINRLIRTNWWRTFFWTVAFLISIILY